MRPNLFMPLGDPDKIENSHPYLYHYTSISALCGILERNQLWFGYTKNMNDTSEIAGFLDDIVSKLNIEFPTETSRKTEIIKSINSIKEDAHSYVMSFSGLEDDAAQWERYGDNATGVCLRINTNVIAKICESYKYCLKKVSYTFEDLSNYDYEYIYKQLSRYITTGTTDNCSTLSLIMFELGFTSIYHKNSAFQSEQEIRLIKHVNMPDDEFEFSKTNVIKRMFVFDMCKHGTTCKELIDEIIIGPRSHQSIDELKLYLEKNNHTELSQRIKKSNCPLR